MPTVAGFDFGKSLGFAVTSDGRTMTCGTAELEQRAKSLGCSVSSALSFFLDELYRDHAISAVAWEDSLLSLGRAKFVRASQVHAKYLAVLELFADSRKLRTIPAVNPKTLKKFGAGNGNASKQDMLEAARRLYRLDLRADEHDAADACHVAAWAYAEYRRRILLDSATKKADI